MNGKQNGVDVLTGSNKDEANSASADRVRAWLAAAAGMTMDAFKTGAERKFGEMTDQYEALPRGIGCRRPARGA